MSGAIASALLMSASAFDPDQFMNTTVSAPNATRYLPCPTGDYNAMIEDVKSSVTDKGKPKMDVVWSIDNADVKAKLGREKVTVRQTIWLDIENGALSVGEGKNVGLGRLRDALGQNTGAAWNPGMLKGGVAKVKVTHRIDKDTGDTFDQVSAVSKLS